MKIRNTGNFTSFKGATININAFSDTHGHIEKANDAYQTLIEQDAFEREEKGKANYLIVGGDWFMSGNKKGFISNPLKPLMDFQLEMFNNFVGKIKGKFPNLNTIFIVGNHDTDCGKELFLKTAKNIDADIIMTNFDFDNPNEMEEIIEEGNFVDSKIDFVEDDKNPDLMHPVLNLGISPVNLQYYQNEFKDFNLFDNVKKNQKAIKPEEYEKTLDVTRKKIDDFKEQYPNGVVILTCHTGVDFADNCAALGGIDLIFDGHEHKEGKRYVNDTPIVELSQNFKKMFNVKIIKDDFGKTEKIDIKPLYPDEKPHKKGQLDKEYHDLFKKDLEKIYTIKSTDKNLKNLDIQDVRIKNNYLANLMTDVMLKQTQKVDPDVDIFALNSSSIRGELEVSDKPCVSYFDLSNSLGGLNPDQADIVINEVKGSELLELISSDYLFHQIDPKKNPMIHYGGLTINKTELLEKINSADYSNLCQYVILDKTGAPIDPNQTYKIANPEKYFIKATHAFARELGQYSKPTGLNAIKAFEDYFKENKEITIEPKTKVY